MSVSFHQWRGAQRRQFDADLRRLRRGSPLASRIRRTRGRLRFGRLRRSTWWMLAFVALAIGAAAWSPEGASPEGASPEGAGVAHGSATVVDGDTLRIGGESIRLHGIDAPELVQFCADGWLAGDAARRALASRVAAGTPQCERMGTDRYGRTTAVCRVNGEDIGAALVRSGMAWAYATYSYRYLPQEWLAWSDRVGVHAHRCASPASWRATHR